MIAAFCAVSAEAVRSGEKRARRRLLLKAERRSAAGEDRAGAGNPQKTAQIRAPEDFCEKKLVLFGGLC